MKMTIECPASDCGCHFADRNRASLIAALGAAVEVNHDQQSATKCPECGQAVEFGLLMLDEDGVWRVSRFAGHADDVTLVRPPGGGVAYQPARAKRPVQAPEGSPAPEGLPTGRPKLRERALMVIEGDAAQVSPAAQRDAVELALETAVLGEAEVAGAQEWLARHGAL